MVKMKPDDPAYWMLFDGVKTTPVVHSDTCYICRDPEFAQMGLPLCTVCLVCGAHVPADDCVCDNGHDQPSDPLHEWMIRREHNLVISDELWVEAMSVISENRENVMDEIVQAFKDAGRYTHIV